MAKVRKQLEWFELPGEGGGVEHACAYLCLWTYVFESVWEYVHLDGRLDIYLQVLLQKTEVNIQETK